MLNLVEIARLIFANGAQFPVSVPPGLPAPAQKYADLRAFEKFAKAGPNGEPAVLAHCNVLTEDSPTSWQQEALSALIFGLADLQSYANPSNLAMSIAPGSWGFIGCKWNDLNVGAGKVGLLSELETVQLLMRRVALALFTDGYWGPWSLAALPQDELHALLSFNPGSYANVDSAEVFNNGGALVRPPPCAPWSPVPKKRNGQCLFWHSGSMFNTGLLWDPNPIFNFWEANQVLLTQARLGFAGPWTKAQACAGVSDYMRLRGWIHGRQMNVNQWYNALPGLPKTPASPSGGYGINARFEHMLYRKVGGCNFNASYLQAVLRTMNLATVVYSAPILGTTGESPPPVQGAPRVFNFGPQFNAGVHRGVACLSAGLALIHGDDAMAEFGRLSSPSVRMWVPMDAAGLFWSAALAFGQKKGQALASHTAGLASIALNTANSVSADIKADAIIAWWCAVFGLNGALNVMPKVPPFSSDFSPSVNVDLGYTAWAMALLYGINNPGSALGFGSVLASEAGSAAAVASDWSMVPLMQRRKAALTRAFACAVCPAAPGATFQPGKVAPDCWAVQTLAAALWAKATKDQKVLDLSIKTFYRMFANNPSWAQQVWPYAQFNILGISIADLGGIGGNFNPGMCQPPDWPEFLPSCQSYRLYPNSNEQVTPTGALTIQNHAYQWDRQDVRDAIVQFATQAVIWAQKFA